jgi:hypothetical protein
VPEDDFLTGPFRRERVALAAGKVKKGTPDAAEMRADLAFTATNAGERILYGYTLPGRP